MVRLRNNHFDPLAAARAAEIDEVLDELATFVDPPPVKVGVMFESLLLSYAALASRNGSRVVLLSQSTYDRAKETGMLAWCREHYPNLTFEPPSRTVRGCHPSLEIMDEAVNF